MEAGFYLDITSIHNTAAFQNILGTRCCSCNKLKMQDISAMTHASEHAYRDESAVLTCGSLNEALTPRTDFSPARSDSTL
jgi:hypothetical protein